MKPGAIMKSIFAGLLVFGALAAFAASARADDWKLLGGSTKDIDIYVMKDPKITGGIRNVQLKFVNHSDFNIDVDYSVIIRCIGEGSKDAATGNSHVKNHSEDATSFSYTVCADDDPDDVRMIEVRIKELVTN